MYVHVAWATWDRLPLLVGDVERRVHRAISAKCREMGAEVVALDGVEDHVHLLVRLPPSLSLAQLVGQVKGSSSHMATHEIDPHPEFFKWQGAYGAVSVSPRALPDVRDYIAHQKTHHAEHSLMPEWEPHTQADSQADS